MSQEEIETLKSTTTSASRLVGDNQVNQSRFKKVLESFGLTKKDIQMMYDLTAPLISDYIARITLSALGAGLIKAINQKIDKEGGKENLRYVSMYLAYQDKTGRTIDQEIDEYLDAIADALEESREIVMVTLKQVDSMDAGEEEKLKIFDEKMNDILEQKLKQFNIQL